MLPQKADDFVNQAQKVIPKPWKDQTPSFREIRLELNFFNSAMQDAFNADIAAFQRKILEHLLTEKEKSPYLIDKVAEHYSGIVKNKKVCPICHFQYSTKKQKCGKPCGECDKCLNL